MKLFLLLVALLFGAVSLPASANYAINGQCFATATAALDSFTSGYPRTQIYNNSATVYVAALSVVSASINAQNLTYVLKLNATNQASVTVPIVNCTAPTQAGFDLTQALAAFSFFFSAVILIFVVSHGGGAILNAIKKGGTRLLG